MLWLALSLLAAGAVALVALPFIRTREGAGDAAPAEADLTVLKSQLVELDRDAKAGEMDADSAGAMRVEIERRMLNRRPDQAPARATTQSVDRVTAAAIAAIVVLGSVALYAATGRPDLASATPHAASAEGAAAGAQRSLPDVDTMIERLATRLRTAPNDAEGWRMLGWSYVATERFPQAVDAYRRAVALAPTNAGYRSALAEALVSAANGTVTDEALRELRRASAADAGDRRTQFYLTLAKAQHGDPRGAIDDWIALLRNAPADDPWGPRIREQVTAVAQQNNISIAGRLPPAPPSAAGEPSADAVASARAMPADAQAQMISGMVEGLDQRLRANPRDAEGWVRLMRSRQVLNQPEAATDALRRGLAAFADDPATQQRLRAAASDLGVAQPSR